MQPVTDMVCRWDAPGGAGSVFLSASTIRDLRTKAIDAFVSLPKRGVETGGLLFGREQGGHLFIQGSEEVSCEHRYGPSFTLSDADRARLAGRLAQARRDGSLPVIGFYRSYTGREGVLETAEMALLREGFPQGPFVFLLLQPVSSQICTAGFRLCRDGELLPEPPYAPVSFEPEQFNGAAEAAPVETDVPADPETALEPDLQAAPSSSPAPAEREVVGQAVVGQAVVGQALDQHHRTSSSPAPAERALTVASPPRLPPPYRSLAIDQGAPEIAAPERSARTRWWLPVVLSLLFGVGGAVLYEFWTLGRQPQFVELHLDAQPSADARSLVITWDAAAPKSVSATHALLGISDGSVHLDVPLSQEQVQLGHYLYTPAHPDLELRLILYGKGPALSGGALRLAPAPRLVAQQIAEPAGAARATEQAPARLAQEPGPQTIAQEAAAQGVAEQSPAPRVAQQAPTPPVTQQSPAPRVAQEPVAPQESPKPSPLPSPRAVVHEVQPRLSDGIRARLRDRVEIPVEVKINAGGRVTAASTPSTGDGLRKYLAGEAVKAARQWRFAPARRGALPSTVKTISFSFAP